MGIADKSGDVAEAGGFPVVGVGASAGGLAAFEAFFSGMPAKTDMGMAFVLVQHLAPDHKSILTELITRYTRMKTFEVEDGMRVQADCAYIIPPNHDMTFSDGTLHLRKHAASHGKRMTIDSFFRSLAFDQRDRAICIVLSGTGSDGTQGLREIKAEGGMAMAQIPESTEFAGMPQSAIDTGLVDYVAKPAEMPGLLLQYAKRTFRKSGAVEVKVAPDAANSLRKIFVMLKNRTAHDFSLYKPNTVLRRIERRMAVSQTDSIDAYTTVLEQKPEEVDALFRDLLIGVTGFFRDPDAFSFLEQKVIPEIFANLRDGSSLRVWIPGCSTGEEAYSIAILLHEFVETRRKNCRIQVFATDIDGQAIGIARAGKYQASRASELTPARFARYFNPEAGGNAFRINKAIRDMIVFSEQDMIKDPSFSKMDLICCRNLLIYISGEMQKRIIPLFHYSLKPGGFLFLGTSETIGEFDDLFETLDRKHRIFRRKADISGVRRAGFGKFIPSSGAEDGDTNPLSGTGPSAGKISLSELTERALLREVAPAGALVAKNGDILYLHGSTGLFLELAPGESGVNNIIKMAREGLQVELSTALRKAVVKGETVRRDRLRIKSNGSFVLVNFSVRPVTPGSDLAVRDPRKSPAFPYPPDTGLFLVVFQESGGDASLCRDADPGAGFDADERVVELKEELHVKEEYLKTVNGELETSNEDLKSINEEMQSINEEMQSTNEELETSKEELQSVNEELTTVNTELQGKVAELTVANNDMNNLLSGTGIATIFVDYELKILRFTPTATKIINLIPADRGRPVGHIVSNLVGYDRLVEDTQAVLNTLIPKAIEVQTLSGSWYSMRILPYRTLDNVIEGAVISFVDITDRKWAEESIMSLLAEKDIILKEVHHRIKNNMGTMMSMLSMQAETLSDPMAIAAIKDSESRVRSMMVLYEKLYCSADFQEVSIKTYLPSLVDGIIANFPNANIIRVEKTVDDFNISARILFSLGIVINELLTNIMKYAFVGRAAGLIDIRASIKERHAIITVKDDGNGMSAPDTEKRPAGFGIMLVEMLMKQINGTIRVENSGGTKVVLEFENS